MTLASGRLYDATVDGNLSAVDLTGTMLTDRSLPPNLERCPTP
jgi:hypothetical protein